MELLGPSAAGLFLAGIAVCLYLVMTAGHVRIPDDPPEVDAELDELLRLHVGDSETSIDTDTDTDTDVEPETVRLQSVA